MTHKEKIMCALDSTHSMQNRITGCL